MLQPATAGVAASLAGFASSFTVVLAGLTAVGASPAQAASGLLGLCVLLGSLSLVVSWRYRQPVSFAWSTPGAAVLAAAAGAGVTFPEAVGAFLLCGALVVLTGAWPALARLVTRVPPPLSGALLAGVLLPLCLAPVTAVAAEPLAGGAVVLVWLVLRRLAPVWAVPAALVVALALTLAGGPHPSAGSGGWAPVPVWTTPQLDPLVLLSLGVPLYLVTMAGQNLPGLAVLRQNGYPHPPARTALVASGAATAVGAPFGVHALNLAALSAAMVAGPDAHPDPRRRWVAAATGGAAYYGLALLSGAAAALVTGAPPVLVQAVAGLALLGAFLGGLQAVVDPSQPPGRSAAAVVALLVVASGVSVAGVGSAVWGLLAGGACWWWLGRRPT